MTTLTQEQLDLQKMIIDLITTNFITAGNTIDVVFSKELYFEEDVRAIQVLFTYRTQEDRDDIYRLLKELRSSGIWFDTAFLISEPTVEWSLDYSIAMVAPKLEQVVND